MAKDPQEIDEDASRENEEETSQEMNEENENSKSMAEVDSGNDIEPEISPEEQEISTNEPDADTNAEGDILEENEVVNEVQTDETPLQGDQEGDQADSEKDGEDEQTEEFNPEIDEELEAKLEEELKKKKKKEKKGMNEQELIEYLSARRNKIQYHALWHLVFNVEDHAATKKGLYDALKEVTSKDPIEPIEEHKFYFGLGFILRLELNGKKIVKFKNGKLVVDTNIDNLKKILEIVGDPISERPILTEKEQKDMIQEFLKDDFLKDF